MYGALSGNSIYSVDNLQINQFTRSCVYTHNSLSFFSNNAAANQFVEHIPLYQSCSGTDLKCVSKVRADSVRLACELHAWSILSQLITTGKRKFGPLSAPGKCFKYPVLTRTACCQCYRHLHYIHPLHSMLPRSWSFRCCRQRLGYQDVDSS